MGNAGQQTELPGAGQYIGAGTNIRVNTGLQKGKKFRDPLSFIQNSAVRKPGKIDVGKKFLLYYIRIMKTSDFTWNENKNQENINKHGVSFVDAQYAFQDNNRIILEDNRHSDIEKRYFCPGKIHGEIMTVRFAYRDDKIRIFGAAYWRKGKKIYEKENSVHR